MDVEKTRQALRAALEQPCTCGGCPTDAALRSLLELDDEALVAAIQNGAAS